MVSQLSDEEFQRLQTQLIELRTANYGLEEQYKKLKIDNQRLIETINGLEREHQKLQKTINRSKKAKDVDLLINKNENLQVKLEAQEEEFRLQSQTLMQELSTLVAANEKLEQELTILKKQNNSLNNNREVQPDILSEEELGELREAIQLFTEAGKDDSMPSSEGDFVKVDESDVIYQKCSAAHPDILKRAEQKLQRLETHHKYFTDTLAQLEAEQKEKQKIEKELKEVVEKLRRKQESLLLLQEEKEKLYVESRKSYEDLQVSKDQEIFSLKDQNQRLQVQLNNALIAMQDHKEKSAQRVEQLESQISLATKKVQNDSKSEDSMLELRAKIIELKCVLGETKQELEIVQQQKAQLEMQLENTQVKLLEQQTLASKCEGEKSQLTYSLEEAQVLAQKRKILVDEMSIRIQQKSSDYKHQLSNLINEFSNKEEKLKEQIEILQEEVEKLSPLQTQLEDALVQIKSLEAMRDWLERRQKETEDSIESTQTYYEGILEHLKVEHGQEVCQIKLCCEQREKMLEEELAAVKCEIKKKNGTIARLEQQVHDAGEEKLLLEKKGAAVTKDLRRQLGAERKRAEKLQERLRDVLNEGTHPRTEMSKTNDPETSSISSWSLMSGNCEPRDSSTHENSVVAGSINHLNGNVSPLPDEQDLEQENYRLLSRITALQQEKWVLEEKINHLEQGSSAMAEDLMRKTELIQYYCMERRSDPVASSSSSPSEKLSVKKFVDMFKGDEHIHESNRRMQRMLEEMLTKNMHLQSDLEHLSREVVRLSKGTDTVST